MDCSYVNAFEEALRRLAELAELFFDNTCSQLADFASCGEATSILPVIRNPIIGILSISQASVPHLCCDARRWTAATGT